ncbi:Dipeptidyl aminopeptidase [Rhizoctonia solani]|uniref:Dipeptidyl aminopeptidase n=1 Tax=Rhizoctonia solani TaxID=456999 RepID=A0A8H7H785_9AGAM|nr:Dipeptidyl aminopeptidase [Rhizoctonia solani]
MANRTNYSPLAQDAEPPEISDVLTDPQAPPIYYGEGRFSPPSSISDDEYTDREKLLDPSRVERGSLDDGDMDRVNVMREPGGLSLGRKRMSPLRCLVLSLGSLVLLAVLLGFLAARTYNQTSYRYRAPGNKHITMDHVFNGTFAADKRSLAWVSEAGDGIYSIEEEGSIKLVDLSTQTNRTLVKRSDVKDEHGNQLVFSSWSLSADASHVLLKTDYLKQYRHSSFGNFYLHRLSDGRTFPLVPPSNPPRVVHAAWSPTGRSIAWLFRAGAAALISFRSPDVTPLRLTYSGNATLFHGVPDWVYEEEVLSSASALWWSPTSSHIAYLSLDETNVLEYVVPVYNPTGDASSVIPYGGDPIKIKYPKPGYGNPLVQVAVCDLTAIPTNLTTDAVSKIVQGTVKNATTILSWDKQLKPEDQIVSEVAWVGNETLIVREVGREAREGHVVLFDVGKTGKVAKGKIVRVKGEKGEEGDKGWIESEQNIVPLKQTPGYLDILPTPKGYNHIALFSPPDSSDPIWLTSGEWEVTGSVLAVDETHGLIYFQAAKHSSIARGVYSVSLPSAKVLNSRAPVPKPAEPVALTDDSTLAWYSASFSPQGGYYVLNYDGPAVPWQKVIGVETKGQTQEESVNYVLTDNDELNKTSAAFQMPFITRSTIESDGYELNFMEIRPPNMDETGRKKYPVLFRVYGGPGSQMVHSRFDRDWHHYLACSLQYIIVVVDGRGTGFKGRKLRNPIRGNLGYWEVVDQINAARIWASKQYVDSKRIGIWGWSYGGFMTSKVLEADAGVHTLGMAVAPVTSWRLYDSVYTERYMGLPDNNPEGYVNASITKVDGFRHANYLLAHGSGDDNVHFANSAHLLDMLTQAKVRGFRFRMFTDSDHSIRQRGAYRELHEWMTEYLKEKWGSGPRQRGW